VVTSRRRHGGRLLPAMHAPQALNSRATEALRGFTEERQGTPFMTRRL